MNMNMGNDIFRLLKSTRSNLKESHKLDFYFYFPTQYEARAANIDLIMEGLTADVKPAAMGNNWLCLASMQIVPDVVELNKLGKKFETIAAMHNGEYDGWESDIQE